MIIFLYIIENNYISARISYQEDIRIKIGINLLITFYNIFK